MNHWPTTGSLLFVATEQNQGIAYDFVKTVLCGMTTSNLTDNSTSTPNGYTDNNLALWEAGSHPDFKVIQPEDSRSIKIDQIRSLNEWAHEKPSIATKKVAIFHPADAFNIQAANALLKTLEEPSPTTLFILITAHPQRLLPTIRSRCHIIRYRTDDLQIEPSSQRQPKELQQNQELQQTVARDLASLEQGEIGPIKLAESWSKKDVGRMLYWVIVYLNECARKSAVQNQCIRNRSWWAFFEHVMQAKQALDEKSPVNVNLLVEVLLIQYTKVIQEQPYGR